MLNQTTSSQKLFLFNVMAIVAAYYFSILLHEWGHGTIAWIYGLKSTPFSVQYGGWLLLNVDEHVDYNFLLQNGEGTAAALIGIAGPIVSLILLLISLWLLNDKKWMKHALFFISVYWVMIFNMIPLIQYFTVSLFALEGDSSRFAEGLGISRWWIFIPGTCFNSYMVWRILTKEMIKAYILMPISSNLGRSLLLFITLFVMFWFIYAQGFNPLTVKGLEPLSQFLAFISILLVPMLFGVCYPGRGWVKKCIEATTRNFLAE
jgi:hypothetical protein